MRHILLIAAFAVTACARSEPVDETPENIAIADPLEDELNEDEDAAAAGSWQPGAEGAAQAIAFQAPNGELLFSIRCDIRGGLILLRPGLVTRGNLALMQLRTGDTVRRLAATTTGGSQPQVQATVPYNDQLISALMRFDEPLEVRFEGLETLVLPPSPAVGDLVRTCQQDVDAAQSVAAGGDNAVAPAPPAPAEPQPQPQN